MFIWIGREPTRSRFVNRDVLFTAMTRLNVKAVTPGAIKLLKDGTYDEWCARRVELFRAQCLPSMLNQQVKPAAWVILFDKDLTPPVASLFEELVEYDWIVPLLLGDDWDKRFVAETREVFARRFGHRQPAYSCCTRLDSDDSLHREFHVALDGAIAKARKTWTAESSVCLNFPIGAMSYDGLLLSRPLERQFFAVVEPFSTFRGPYRGAHTRIHEHMPVIDVFTNRPMFVYWRHEQNITGPRPISLDFELFAHPRRILESFGLRWSPALLEPN